MPFSENEGHEFSENGGVEIFTPQCNADLTQVLISLWKSVIRINL
jgi:hypothetical protein